MSFRVKFCAQFARRIARYCRGSVALHRLVGLFFCCRSFSPLDSKFATCSDDGTVRIWDFMRCHEESILRGMSLIDPTSYVDGTSHFQTYFMLLRWMSRHHSIGSSQCEWVLHALHFTCTDTRGCRLWFTVRMNDFWWTFISIRPFKNDMERARQTDVHHYFKSGNIPDTEGVETLPHLCLESYDLHEI